uniref:NADH-ubiquinone oxidoreductase chain 2 n=1 Tax=Ampulex compressa TaxID=860918 RepID=A0A343DRK5_AMPCP|nr:NADH dehydrogenase subunit 2 [Ampulex compressa]
MNMFMMFCLLPLIVLVSFIGFLLSSFLNLWLFLEISGLLFLVMLMNFSKYNSLKGSVSVIIYYLVQVISSSLLLISVLYVEYLDINSILSILMIFIMLISLLMKLGIFPFHFWVPLIMKNLSWILNYVLMTYMKIIPLIMMMNLRLLLDLMMVLIIMSSMVSVFMSMKQISLKLIYSYSSINHTSWMVMSVLFFKDLFYIYYFIYILILLMLILFMEFYSLEYITDFSYLFMYNLKMYMIYYVNLILGMGGLPLFLGFIMKWMVIYSLISVWGYIFIYFMIFFSVLMIWVYIRMGMYLLYIEMGVIKNLYIYDCSMNWKFMIVVILVMFLSYLLMYL